MDKRKLSCFGGALILLMAVFSAAMAQTPGSSPSNPASIGVATTGIVECGQGYTSHELYDMKLTLLEVFRGEEAWTRLKAASSSNKPAAAGNEYVIAHVKFEYRARGTPGLCIHQIVPGQFTAFSADGIDYKSSAVAPPKPEMRKDIKSGETMDGWVAFAVAQQDKTPIMAYSADEGGAVEHGGMKWFQLYH